MVGVDYIIIGAGIAGLSAAYHLAKHAKVALISKGPIKESSTAYAQGGIAAVLDAADSIDAHTADTLVAGAGLCHENAVRFTVERSRQAIEWLISQGVAFTRESNSSPNDRYNESNNDYHLAREGGHSSRRIIHAADATGKALSETLVERLQEHPSIETLEHHVAIDIVVERDNPTPTCSGVYVLNCKTNKVETFHARFVVIATGGASKAYLYTSNPDGASGDGLSLIHI